MYFSTILGTPVVTTNVGTCDGKQLGYNIESESPSYIAVLEFNCNFSFMTLQVKTHLNTHFELCLM